MQGMNGNKSSCLQLTTAQTRIAEGIRLRKGGWMCLTSVPGNAPGMWSTWWVLGRLPKTTKMKIISRPAKFCLCILMCFSIKKE